MTFFSNIWRNEKSREIIVQIIVLFFLGWFISWLVMNVNANFEALGKEGVIDGSSGMTIDSQTSYKNHTGAHACVCAHNPRRFDLSG